MAGGFKLEISRLTGTGRERAAEVLDEHALEMRDLLAENGLKPGERMGARDGLTRALLMALELRAVDEDEGGAAALRARVDALTRENQQLRTALERAGWVVGEGGR